MRKRWSVASTKRVIFAALLLSAFPLGVLWVAVQERGAFQFLGLRVTVPGFENWLRGVYWQTPTATYQAEIGRVLEGTFHELRVTPQGETVFYLQLDSISIRLIFYCNPQPTKVAGRSVTVWDFCTERSQLPIRDGQHIKVKGTLITPSDWKPELSTPRLTFTSDLYVMQILSV